MLIKSRLGFILIATIALLCFSTPAKSQNRKQTIKIPLKIEPNTQSRSARSVFDERMKFSENEKSGRTLNGSLIIVQRDENDSDKFYVLIDSDNDGNLTNENKIVLSNNEKITIEIRKAKNALVIPYEFSVTQNEKGAIFLWRTNIQASGRINVKNCSAAIYLQDLNGDGNFEHLEQGTNLQIDRNNDGKIWGKEEWFYSKEIIEFCGQNFLISSIAPDGSFLSIERTNLQIAKIGMKSPRFDIFLLNGKKISFDKLIGKPILLDFWASWCSPCVEKLPEAKSLEKDISVFFINTDKKDRVRFADQIITRNDLRNNSMMSGTGEDDVLWKTFARINNSLPFYVLIDQKGVIVYAGTGGEELKDLKDKITEIK